MNKEQVLKFYKGLEDVLRTKGATKFDICNPASPPKYDVRHIIKFSFLYKGTYYFTEYNTKVQTGNKIQLSYLPKNEEFRLFDLGTFTSEKELLELIEIED